MKNILGFSAYDESDLTSLQKEEPSTEAPVRSLVQVRFSDDHRILTYYNDQFDLHEGDLVHVSGKLSDRLGTVASVSTKFKIRLSDYEKITEKITLSMNGRFRKVGEWMVSDDPDALAAEAMRAWVKPPRPRSKKLVQIDPKIDGVSEGWAYVEEEDETIQGDGYEAELDALERCEDLRSVIWDRAVNYLREGRVKYISLGGGEGTAFVEGTTWYEVNFRYDGGRVTDIYCDCPYPGMCKHETAALLALRLLGKEKDFDLDRDFTALDRDYFWELVEMTHREITL